MRLYPNSFLAVTCVTVLVATAGPADASIELISNGGFETGNFSGWTVTNSGSGNWFINDGTFVPGSPGTALPPISGSFDAVTSQVGDGTHILSDQFAVPIGITSASLSWADRIRNYADVFSDPNQEFRVEILNGANAVVATPFSTNPGDPLIQLGPNNRSFDVTAVLQSLAGQMASVRFVEQDNLFFLNATIDNVSLLVDGNAAIPEPTTFVVWSLLSLVGTCWRRRKGNG